MTSDELMALARDVNRTTLEPSDILLTGRIAVVTGGGGGIGQGAAIALAKFGAKVAILDIEPARCADTEAAIRAAGGEAIGIPTDVMDSGQIRSALARTLETFGGVDILINNAGGVRGGRFLTMPEASMRKHLEINLVSTLIATQEAAKLMVAAGRGGNIVNVASIEAFRAAPMFAVYSACKAGMVQFTRTMAVELAEHDIRVNCIAPDHTITPGMKGNRSGPVTPETWEDSGDEWASTIPAGREGVVAETSSTIIYLCSKMSEYVTGVTINVDGGTWASSGWHRDGQGGFILNP